MARVFNQVVFDQTITGDPTTPAYFYTSQEHAALLGSVERLQIQLVLRGSTGFNGEVKVQYQITNSPEYEAWLDSSAPQGSVLATAVTDLPMVAFMQVDTIKQQGAFGRFKIHGNTSTTMQFQLIVPGYAD